MKSLFGDDIPDVPAKHRKDHGHAAPIGSGPKGKTCKDCIHCGCIRGYSKLYYKCEFMRHHWTHGPGSDIRLKDAACRLFNEEVEQ